MTPPRTAAMAAAVRRGEWERIAVYLALAVLARARELPEGSLDDLLALLDTDEEAGHDRRRQR